MNQQHLNASEGSKRVANVLETWPYKYEVKTWNSWGKARAYSESYERSANYWKFVAGAKILVLLYYALCVCFAPVERLLFAAETLALRFHKSHVRAPTLCACFKQAKKKRRGFALKKSWRVYWARDSSQVLATRHQLVRRDCTALILALSEFQDRSESASRITASVTGGLPYYWEF